MTLFGLGALSFMNSDKQSGLNVGDVAPDFTAKNQDEKEVNLKQMLKSGSVVLIFYRGEWCPFCNTQLKALEDSLSFITEKGASVIAVSPEKGENIDKTLAKTNATYAVVSDENRSIMNAYQVAFELDEATAKKYKGYGVDLSERNGTNGNALPVPAVYIIGQNGTITFRYFNEDYRKRASVKEIIEQL